MIELESVVNVMEVVLEKSGTLVVVEIVCWCDRCIWISIKKYKNCNRLTIHVDLKK